MGKANICVKSDRMGVFRPSEDDDTVSERTKKLDKGRIAEQQQQDIK